MQATLTASPLMLRHPDAATARGGAQGDLPSTFEPGAAVDSSALLQGHKAVSINHNGAIYRLQATKLGKLILTK